MSFTVGRCALIEGNCVGVHLDVGLGLDDFAEGGGGAATACICKLERVR